MRIKRLMSYNFVIIVFLLSIVVSGLQLPGSAQSTAINKKIHAQNKDQIPAEVKVLEYEGVEIRWLGCAGFQYKRGDFIVYTDPYQLRSEWNLADGDIIYCTHDHVDHFSPMNIEMVCSASKTTLISVHQNQAGMATIATKEDIIVNPYDVVTIENVTFEVVPAYNRYAGRTLHPRGVNYTGVIIDFGGVRIYQTGDTDDIPEMESFVCDIVVLPVINNNWVMSPSEAAQAVEKLKTSSNLQAAIPMHYDTWAPFGYTGPIDRAYEFRDLADTRVVILEKYGDYVGNETTYVLPKTLPTTTSTSEQTSSLQSSETSSSSITPTQASTPGFGWFIGIFALGTSILILISRRAKNKRSR
ncbi:MAG: MBL fold metallo-hydrolase [Candidatus Hodarchaeota archaeon]